MGRPKKTDKGKKPSQVDGAVRTEDVGVMDPAVERNVILTDGNDVDGGQFDADNGDNGEAGVWDNKVRKGLSRKRTIWLRIPRLIG